MADKTISPKKCPACGGTLTFLGRFSLHQVDLLQTKFPVALYKCRACSRLEFYSSSAAPADAECDAFEEESRARLREFNAQVEAGVIAAEPFVCPKCGNVHRNRVCADCGCVMDLKTMTVVDEA